MKYQKVKYKLINNDTGQSIWLSDNLNDPEHPAPQNWDDAEKALKRSTKTFGVYTELSKNLVFTKKGAEFLREAYFFKDIEADVALEEHKAYPNEDGFYLHSTGVFDFSDYESDKLTVKVPFKTGGLNALIKSQLKEKFELERLESINGKEIDPIEKIDVAVTSRSIFLLSELIENRNETVIFSGEQFGGGYTQHRQPISLEIQSQSDEANISMTFQVEYPSISYTGSGSTGEMFYLISDRDKNNVRVNIDLEFTINENTAFFGGVDDKDMFVRLKRYNNGNAFDFVENVETYLSITDNVMTHKGETFNISTQTTLDILEGESLSLCFEISADYGIGIFFVSLDGLTSTVVVQEDSVFPESQTKAVFIKDVYEQEMRIITGESGRFVSDFYTNGDFSKTAVALGLWIRGFYEENIEISLGDTIDTTHAIHGTGYTIEVINGIEVLVVEDLKYFFQDQTVIRLPYQVSKLERKAAKEFAHSSILFGYKDPPEDNKYEELMGLDEYNVRTGYTLPITRTDTTFKKVAPFRADPTAKELARRKPKLNFPEQDTRYDKSIHLLDLKTGLGTAYEERVWQDDYEIEPTGIYAPENATNLRLTPFRNSERHQWFYGSALTKFQEESVRFSNSDGNKDLVTKKTGEVARPENGNLLVSELDRPRFVNQWITFNHEVDFDINQQVYGKTLVNGREIPNYFFKVEFINELGKKEYGYLFELKPNKEGNWKILKAL